MYDNPMESNICDRLGPQIRALAWDEQKRQGAENLGATKIEPMAKRLLAEAKMLEPTITIDRLKVLVKGAVDKMAA